MALHDGCSTLEHSDELTVVGIVYEWQTEDKVSTMAFMQWCRHFWCVTNQREQIAGCSYGDSWIIMLWILKEWPSLDTTLDFSVSITRIEGRRHTWCWHGYSLMFQQTVQWVPGLPASMNLWNRTSLSHQFCANFILFWKNCSNQWNLK